MAQLDEHRADFNRKNHEKPGSPKIVVVEEKTGNQAQ
jgi:hypothetical protein